MDFWRNSKVCLALLYRYKFRILFRTVLIVTLSVSLSSLPGVKRPTASVICFISSILRKSDPGYFLSYLRYVSACYSGLDFVMLVTYAS